MKKIFKIVLHSFPRTLLIRASYLIRPLLAFFMQGSTHTDPINGKSFRAFLPYGYGTQRDNVLSPGTLSLERHRLLWLYLKNETSFFSAPLSVLHFAPEQAFYHRFKRLKNLDYTTTDLTSPLADIKADICNLPFNDNHFDVVLCNHVLEHIQDDMKAMQELYRVMKPGGWGIFQVPQDLDRETTFQDDTITHPKERTRIFGQYDHIRVYGLDYFNTLRTAGFIVEEVPYAHYLTTEQIDRYVVNEDEIIPICRKPQ